MASAELLFKAMSDPTRQRLVRVLSTHELSVSELVEVLGQPQSTISRHLKVLRESGLLADRRLGTTVRYATLPPNPVEARKQARKLNGDVNGLSGTTHVAALRDRLLDWAAQGELDEAARHRLERVLHRLQNQESDFFEVVGARWDQLRIEAFGESFHLEALTALLPSEWTVADIGTGTGYMLGILSTRFKKVIAVDPANAMLKAAHARPEVKTASNVEFRQGALSDLPIANGEVDLIVASLVLHHVPEPAEALTELKRCLRMGGRMLIIEQTLHNGTAFHERMGDLWSGFPPDTLSKWVKGAGFSDIIVRPLNSARSANGRVTDAPPLFVLAARRSDDGVSCS